VREDWGGEREQVQKGQVGDDAWLLYIQRGEKGKWEGADGGGY
jgi:hypothetical protein